MGSPLNDLNNYLQDKKSKYNLASLSWRDTESGTKHETIWTSTCKLDDLEFGTGSAKTKRLARTSAARKTLAALRELDKADAAALDSEGMQANP